jgi:hypothetical protein
MGKGRGERQRSAVSIASAAGLGAVRSSAIDVPLSGKVHRFPVSPYSTPKDVNRWDATAQARQARRDARNEVERLAAAEVSAYWNQCLIQRPADFDNFQQIQTASAALMQRWMKASENVRYEYHCVLDGSPITFGIEIEFIGDLSLVARAMHEAGLSLYPEPLAQNAPRGWTVKEDTTVSSGGEIVSPILRDQPACWQQVRKALATLRKTGSTIDNNCGFHVHLGAFRLDGQAERFRRLWKLNASSEDLLYRLSAPGGKRKHRGISWTQPLTEKGYAPIHTVADFQIQASHMDALNFENVGTARNTVEFRYPNSTFNHLEVQALISVFGGMVEAAREPLILLDESTVSSYGSHARGMNLDLHHSSIRRFADILFPKNSRSKLRLLWLYNRTRWQGENEVLIDFEQKSIGRLLRYPALAD